MNTDIKDAAAAVALSNCNYSKSVQTITYLFIFVRRKRKRKMTNDNKWCFQFFQKLPHKSDETWEGERETCVMSIEKVGSMKKKKYYNHTKWSESDVMMVDFMCVCYVRPSFKEWKREVQERSGEKNAWSSISILFYFISLDSRSLLLLAHNSFRFCNERWNEKKMQFNLR